MESSNTNPYDRDFALTRSPSQYIAYGALILLLLGAPWLVSDYLLSQATFILIYGVVGLGLMLLCGYTGLFSIGHAAFLGIGAYTEAALAAKGVPIPISMAAAAILCAVAGVIVGLPAIRVKGIYLAIATLAFCFIVEEIFVRWDSVTGGNVGRSVTPVPTYFSGLESGQQFYLICALVAILSTVFVLNLLRSPTGRALIALRDSEISAQSMGIPVAFYKSLSFALSAALTGVGGALYAHQIQFLTPDQFGVAQSIDLIMMLMIGGLGSVHGAFLGAIFLISMPPLIGWAKDFLPSAVAQSAGVQGFVYGAILVICVLLEPHGMYGRWIKIRTAIAMFPLYPVGMFRRQKAYLKSERA
ncbi:MAG: branched-chain amino acid ABC transporter permease [Devosia sp.]